MADLAILLGRVAGEGPVVDRTGIEGKFQIEFMNDSSGPRRAEDSSSDGDRSNQGPLSASEPTGHTLRDSLAKLGLKLVHQTAPIEFLVVDHIEKLPTEN